MADAFANPDNGNIPDAGKHPIAFPTAIGFGRVTSVRANNAVVYKINSLEDTANPGDGKITYRECAKALQVTSPYNIPAGRPRYCVFDVSGSIQLQSEAWITVPKIYIAGQTSPGGIEFRLGSNYNPVDSLIDTRRGGDHLIARHIRARLGEHANRPSDNGDSIRFNGTRYQILDHVTSMYGTDESIEAGCTDCTIQWSIIGPNICRDAGHSSALHCKTFFLKPGNRVSVAYNLSQHGVQRGLNVAPGVLRAVAGNTSQVDVLNNVIYNFVEEGGLISNQFGSVYANYIGNTYFRGAVWTDKNGNYWPALYNGATTGPFGFSIYMKDNVSPRNRISGQFGSTVTDFFKDAVGFFNGVTPSTICGTTSNGLENCAINGKDVVQNNGFVTAPGINGKQFEDWMISSPMQAMRNILSFGGADLCRDGSCRDNIDRAFIDDLRTCDSPPYLVDNPSTITSAASLGGYARFNATGGAKRDSDNDGMPDDWENLYSNTDANVWDANEDTDGDGYPNIEEYLNMLAQDHLRYRDIYTAGKGALPAYNCGRPQV